MQAQQRDRSRPIAESLVFDLQLSWKGFRINKLCHSLNAPENRKLFQQDEEAYMAKYELDDAQKELIRRRDFGGLLEVGANIYFLLKLGAVTGNGLYRMGASMRGETHEEFLATRNNSGAV